MKDVFRSPYNPDQKKQVLTELSAVLESEAFRRSTASRDLLAFLVNQDLNGAAQTLKESYIGHVHFGRAADYDPKSDALVRVSMRRLRTTLAACYEKRNLSGLRIELPLGSYVPSYVVVQPDNNSFAQSPLEAEVYRPESSSSTLERGGAIGNGVLEEPARRHSAWRRAELWPALHSNKSGGIRTSIVLFLLCVIFLVWRSTQASARRQDPWTAHTLARLGGVATYPAFSPDGQTLAFTWSQSPNTKSSAVFLRGLHSGGIRQLTNQKGESTRPAWSPGGTRIAYVRIEGGIKEVRLISLVDGTDRKIALLHGSFPWLCQLPRISWSRDESTIIAADTTDSSSVCHVVSISVADGSEKVLTTPGGDAIGDVEPSISPDGTHIAFLRNTATMVGDLYAMRLNGSELHRITHDKQDILGFCWKADGSGFVLASNRGDGLLRLWMTNDDASTFARLTDGLVSVGFPAASPDGKTVLFASYHNSANIWRVWDDGRPSQKLISSDAVNADAQTSPDGKTIAFRSNRGSSSEIWLSDSDGGNVRQLTALGTSAPTQIVWSPDGKSLAFECRDQGHQDVCVIAATRGTVHHPVSWASNQDLPAWSSDGRFLYFASTRSGTPDIYRMSTWGGEPAAVSPPGAIRAVPLPGSDKVLFARTSPASGIYAQSPASPNGDTLVLRMEPGKLLDDWDAAPGGLWFLRRSDSGAEIFRVSLIGGRPQHIGNFPHPVLGGDRALTVEPGGKSALVVEQGADFADLSEIHQER